MGSALSSPLESPDILQPFIPLCDIGAATNSMASIKLSSADSINIRNQQVRPIRLSQYTSYSGHTTTLPYGLSLSLGLNNNELFDNNNSKSLSAIPETIPEIPEQPTTIASKTISVKFSKDNHDGDDVDDDDNYDNLNVGNYDNNRIASVSEKLHQINHFRAKHFQSNYRESMASVMREGRAPLVEFSLSSVGRSFIDETDDSEIVTEPSLLQTPDTPTPIISPSSSNRFSETFSNDFNRPVSTPSITVSPIDEISHRPFGTATASSGTNFCGSWDLLELDLSFHDVNFDPSFGGDVEECVFFGDDPLGLLPQFPTPPDGVDL